MGTQQNDGLKIGRRTFLTTAGILVVVLVLAGWLTQILPQGTYDRILVDGRETLLPDSYRIVEAGRLPVWRWFTAPVEVLGTGDMPAVVMIIVFILLIGGTFLVLERSGVLRSVMDDVVRRFGKKRYTLLAVLTFVCMGMGSTMGLFEETVTLIPFSIALALSMGWDRLVGVGMSVLAVSCGFAAGTVNPFTIGVAQRLAGLPAFSGILLRIGVFAAVYGLLLFFLLRYVKRIEADPRASLMYIARENESIGSGGDGGAPDGQAASAGLAVARKGSAIPFIVALLLIFAYLALSAVVPALSAFAMPVMAVLLTIGGILSGIRAGRKASETIRTFGQGMHALAPGAVLILLAMGAKQILSAGGVMDTVLHGAYELIQGAGPYGSVLLMYGFILFLELFIGGSTAKAFLVMPLLLPLADMLGITRQSAVQAFAFGDGFVNMAYPTNAVLLITLGIAGIPFSKWIRWTWKLQAALFIMSCIVLSICVLIKYGPF